MERLAKLRAHLAAAGADVSDPHAAGAAADGRELLGPALQVVERAVAQQRIPGASIAVMRRGELVASAGFGTRDPGAASDPPPFEGDSICYIASLTKPFTAAAGMLLVERGDLGLDDLVSDHLPDFADVRTEDGRAAGHLLTVRDLMCHRSGLGRAFPADLRPSPFFTQAWFSESLESVVAGISKLPLAFLPREDVAYSNTAWYVLARIVELRTGDHFGDFVRREIFGRLGMEDTGFGLPAAKVGRTAVCYSAGAPTIAGVRAEGSDDDDALSLVSKYDSSWDVQVPKAALECSESQGSRTNTPGVHGHSRQMCMPDGGLWASAPDIARWASAFLEVPDGGGGLLAADTVAEMLTQQSYGPVGPDSADGAQQLRGIGLGWHLDLPNQFTHWGFTGTLVWGDRRSGVVGVMFAQWAVHPSVLAEIHTEFRDAVTAAYADEA